jgi:hypothetical protein
MATRLWPVTCDLDLISALSMRVQRMALNNANRPTAASETGAVLSEA